MSTLPIVDSHQDFEAKMSVATDKYEPLAERLVFISDGATWISNWINAAYPQATQILDYYHAKEHLGQFAVAYFTSKQQASEWTEQVGKQLLEQGVDRAINSIQALAESSQTIEKQRAALLNYYTGNAYRSPAARRSGCGRCPDQPNLPMLLRDRRSYRTAPITKDYVHGSNGLIRIKVPFEISRANRSCLNRAHDRPSLTQ